MWKKKKRLHAPGESKTTNLSVFENAWKMETEKMEEKTEVGFGFIDFLKNHFDEVVLLRVIKKKSAGIFRKENAELQKMCKTKKMKTCHCIRTHVLALTKKDSKLSNLRLVSFVEQKKKRYGLPKKNEEQDEGFSNGKPFML